MRHLDQVTGLALLLALVVFLSPAQADEPPSPVASAETSEKYGAEELEEIVGPIALYPDIVVSSILPASTVPTDVVQAARWVVKQGGEIPQAPADSDWDESVQALVQFPDVLTWMSEELDWLEELGYAMSVQEEDVLDAIQAFRAKAKAAGNLESSDKQVVTEEEGAISIDPVEPTIVYVPVYDPVYVVRPGYRYSFWHGVAVGVIGAWAFHRIRWGRWGGRATVNIYKSPTYNFRRGGGVYRPGAGSRWRAPSRPGVGRPAKRPARRPGARPSVPKYNRPGTRPRPSKGGVKPAPARTKPGKKPAAGKRPGATPSRPAPGAGKSPSTGVTGRRTPSKSKAANRSAFSGSSRSGSSTRKASSRGNRSVQRSQGASRSRSGGGGRSSGRSGGGRSRGGGRR